LFVTPIYGRRYEPGQLQFITASTYRRAKLFQLDLFRWYFVQVLRQLRNENRVPADRLGLDAGAFPSPDQARVRRSHPAASCKN
jgi:hypothetical protein